MYEGKHDSIGRCLVTKDGVELDPRYDLWNHSPDGFEWGYMGSGPAQLALAILADHLGDDARAVRLHQDFKRITVGMWPGDMDWFLEPSEITTVVEAIESYRSGPFSNEVPNADR